MLINFSVENFRSFEKRTEFSMIPSTRVSDKPEHTVKTANDEDAVSLLKHGVIYGANASGKSNLTLAFTFVQATVTKQLPFGSSNDYCRTHEENRNKNSIFEIQFLTKGRYFLYRFAVLLSENRIIEECLEELFLDGRRSSLFKYLSNQKPFVSTMPDENTKDNSKLVTYLDDFDENGNVLFLAFMNQKKNYDESSSLQHFPLVFNWLLYGVELCSPGTDLIKNQYFSKQALTQINELLPLFDTGIKEIKFVPMSEQQFSEDIPFPFGKNFLEAQLQEMNEENIKERNLKIGKNYYVLRLGDQNKLSIQGSRVIHSTGYGHFGFDEESDGTNRLYELLGLLLNVEEDKVYFIDELERSLHPKLTEKLLELFNEIHSKKRVQLIFTTHEATIMTLDKFRRDEIWFVEKSSVCTSNLYPLDRFTKEYDSELKTAYFEGRYGAIPVFREII